MSHTKPTVPRTYVVTEAQLAELEPAAAQLLLVDDRLKRDPTHTWYGNGVSVGQDVFAIRALIAVARAQEPA